MRLHAGDTADQAVQATDVDGDPLTFSVNAGPSYMSVTTVDPGSGSATGNIHLAPSRSDAGGATGIVAVYDGVNYRTAPFNITVLPLLVQPQDMTVNEGATADQTLTGSDSDGLTLTFSLVDSPAFASLTMTSDSTANVHLAPGFDESGFYFATVSISDGVASFEGSFRILVNNVDRPPVLTQPIDMHGVPGTTSQQTLTGMDPDGDNLTFSKVSGPSYMSVNTLGFFPRRGLVVLSVPAPSDTGTVPATVAASDGVLSDEKSFLIRVDLNDQPPVLTVNDIDAIEGEDVDEQVVVFDPDGQRLTLTAAQVPPFMTLTLQNQGLSDSLLARIHLATGYSSAGVYSVLLTASDGFIRVTDTLRVVIHDIGNVETSLRLDQGLGGRAQEYSAVDGIFAVYQNSPYDLNFGFVDTLGSGAHWTITFVEALKEGDYDTSDGHVRFYIEGADTILGQGSCYSGPATFQIKRLARRADGTILSFWATFQQACGFPGFHGEMRYQVPGIPMTVVAPSWIAARTEQTTAFSVTAYDSTSAATTISALRLPAGATFVDAGTGRGTFSWAPSHLVAGNHVVGFIGRGTAGQADTAYTIVHVVNTDKPPRALANGPYTGKVGVPIQFSANGSSDPEGDPVTYRWAFGDGGSADGPSASHAYALPGPYGVALLVSDGLLVGGDITLARIYWPDSASASQVRVVGSSHPIHLEAGDARFCVALETVDIPSNISDLDPLTVRMTVKGFGSTDVIPADPASCVLGDANGNGIPDVSACFGSETLRLLFSRASGSIQTLASVEFMLRNGHVFRAALPLDVIAPDGTLRPLLAPNPLRPSGTFSFVTTVEGMARLTLFDGHGRRVRTLLDVPMMPTGYHDLPIDTHDSEGRALPSGIYFYRLETQEGTRTGRLTLLR